LSAKGKKKDVGGHVKPGQDGGKGRWSDFFDRVPRASADFMTERDQGIAEEREPFC
jgi:hypothetical protein